MWPKTLSELPGRLLGFHVQVVKSPVETDGSIEDRLRVLEVEAAARRLVDRYAYCYDAGDIDGLIEIYDEHCVVVNRHGTFVGRDAIRGNYERAVADRAVSFHHLANVQVWPAPSRAEAWATGYIHALSVRDGVAGGSMASFVFHLREEAAGWRIVESRIAISDKHSFGPPRERRTTSPPVPTRPETVADLIDL